MNQKSQCEVRRAQCEVWRQALAVIWLFTRLVNVEGCNLSSNFALRTSQLALALRFHG